MACRAITIGYTVEKIHVCVLKEAHAILLSSFRLHPPPSPVILHMYRLYLLHCNENPIYVFLF
jgi:hypothetical protein